MSRIIEITDFQAPELDPFARLTERELCPRNERRGGLFIAESPNVIHRALDAGYEPVSLLMEHSHVRGQAADVIARCGDVPVYVSETAVLARLTGFQLTRGVLCAMRRKPLPAVEEICAGASRIVVLEDVYNPTNVGAIFRSAAALGMDALLLSPGCCDPLYRRSVRVSMGTVFQLPWARLGDSVDQWPHPGMERLRALGFRMAAMALREDSVPVDHPALMNEEKLAVLMGSEGEGLCDQTISDSEWTVRIPMHHGVDSLNVAAASAVAFWQLANQNRRKEREK